ncbi:MULTISPECIES: thiamine pyrophosphate-binding protein [Brenneria]|uniref:Thiamine pyrophosphate-binding protein n=1 Tax=Brenneria nigrifluens DSM 30175 = ATCC 13028 TaxID=1121120 RepID=A0A2U1UGX2_9GAMM|nr:MULTISPECIES: thiamine pyrophosphate-binding protein [Brenneria]EHD19955.1 Acetolactate synthase [Brenneria sp. EniD312]PWC20911.1 thiamine pyrophosphate-binding protein [Brenneria nigrifluens DSM 30175 = ATCC 13028]QCR03201.1 thiamine pyrophosphate-binding protein [Brenneria nigrifluens DSM 30175 = ATCC 13028]
MCQEEQQAVIKELVYSLKKAGVEAAFGVSGGFIVPLWEALSESSIKVIHCRHESGAAFSASEYSLYNNVPSVVFSTSGPGITNALTGLRTAKLDGAKVIFISATTIEEHNGKWGLQQTTRQDINDLAGDGVSGFFDSIVFVDRQEKLIEAIKAINDVTISYGHVLGIFIPTTIQKEILKENNRINIERITPASISYENSNDAESKQQKIAEALTTGGAILWNGFGCLHAAEILTHLAIKTHTPVMSTPRGKGIFPENHALYIGTTGLGSDSVKLRQVLNNPSLKTVIILGSNLGELSSSYIQNQMNNVDIYYIGLRNEDIKKNLPSNAVIIDTEISHFLHGVDDKVKETAVYHTPQILPREQDPEQQEPIPVKDGVIHPQQVMAIVQKIAIEEQDCLIAADAGNTFVWTNRYLHFPKPNRYRVGTALGAMAHYACGIVGLSASGKTTLGIIGDGSMLMNNEISTAVRYQLPAIWLIMNDGAYNMCRQGLSLLGNPPLDCVIPLVDFSLFATALGANGVRVTQADELETSLRAAIMRGVPAVIDVLIDKDAQPPLLDRINTIKSL